MRKVSPIAQTPTFPFPFRNRLPQHAQDIYREAFSHALPPIQARRCRRRLPTAQRGLVKRSYVKMGDDWVPLHGMR